MIFGLSFDLLSIENNFIRGNPYFLNHSVKLRIILIRTKLSELKFYFKKSSFGLEIPKDD